ncbi:MAG: restriction endonuclease subunit S [Acetivibrio ethanolgignens]
MRTVKLREISELKTGPFGTQFSANEYILEGTPVINVKNIGYGDIITTGLDYVGIDTLERLADHKLREGDIVFGRKGSVDRHCLITKGQDGWMQGSDCIRVRFTDSFVLPDFVSYYLLTDAVKAKINNSAVGSTMASLNTDILGDIEINLPSHEEQSKIAATLSAIDRKIRNNNCINDYLEEMAKALYDYWFVQFDFPNENGKPYKSSGGKMVNANGHIIPEGWTFCKVQDIISNICTGLNPRDNFKLGTGDIKYITVKNLTTNGTLDFTGCDTIDESARAIVHNRSDIQIGDILFASIAPLGRCYLIQSEPTDWDINESVFSIRANTDIVTPSFLYLYFMSDAFIKQATSSSTGSIFKGIRINTLLETELCVPPLSVILKFEERLASTFPLKSKNYEEIQRLSNLRDWLLPMLMNGQATIGD